MMEMRVTELFKVLILFPCIVTGYIISFVALVTAMVLVMVMVQVKTLS